MFTVVIPTIDKSTNYYKNCIASVKEFSPPNTQIVIVEDQTVAQAWNTGIKSAKYDNIAIINDDTVMSSNWLEGLKKPFNNTNTGVVAPGIAHLNQHNSGIHTNHVWFPGCAFMLTKKTIDKVGLFDESFEVFYNDTDYWTRVIKKKLNLVRNFDVKIKHLESQTVQYFNPDEQMKIGLSKFIDKHRFNPHEMFYGNGNIAKELNTY